MPKAVINIKGGLVQAVFATTPDLEIEILDEDVRETGLEEWTTYLAQRRHLLTATSSGHAQIDGTQFPHKVY
jgi:hypothetical protein